MSRQRGISVTVLSAASQGQRLHTRSTFSLHDKIGKILKSVMAYSPNCPLSPLPWPAPLPWTFYLINAEPLLFKTVSSSRIRETGALKWATGTPDLSPPHSRIRWTERLTTLRNGLCISLSGNCVKHDWWKWKRRRTSANSGHPVRLRVWSLNWKESPPSLFLSP